MFRNIIAYAQNPNGFGSPPNTRKGIKFKNTLYDDTKKELQEVIVSRNAARFNQADSTLYNVSVLPMFIGNGFDIIYAKAAI